MTAPELSPAASSIGPERDVDGYAELRSYAPIGDTRTIGLVALDGAVDWWPILDLDSCPTFAAVLDARNGGRLELTPVEPATTTRRYLPGTNVLETTHVTGLRHGSRHRRPQHRRGRAPAVDGAGPPGRGRRGAGAMRFVVAPGTCLNSSSPWAHDTVHGTVFRVHDVTLAVRLLGELETDVGDQAARGGFTTFRGSRHLSGSPRRRTSRCTRRPARRRRRVGPHRRLVGAVVRPVPHHAGRGPT